MAVRRKTFSVCSSIESTVWSHSGREITCTHEEQGTGSRVGRMMGVRLAACVLMSQPGGYLCNSESDVYHLHLTEEILSSVTWGGRELIMARVPANKNYAAIFCANGGKITLTYYKKSVLTSFSRRGTHETLTIS